MAGNPVDLTVYRDTNPAHDHTYYGNACPGAWSDDGSTGSTTPCNSRVVATLDDGNQENGTYYTFQASTSGTGSTIAIDNANSPDTFCPLGWQLPYSGKGGDYYDKSKSGKYLLSQYSIGNDSAGSEKIRSYPLSFVPGGYFDVRQGRLFGKDLYANYWPSTTTSIANGAYRITLTLTRITADDTSNRDVEYTLRCGRFVWHPGNEPI